MNIMINKFLTPEQIDHALKCTSKEQLLTEIILPNHDEIQQKIGRDVRAEGLANALFDICQKSLDFAEANQELAEKRAREIMRMEDEKRGQ